MKKYCSSSSSSSSSSSTGGIELINIENLYNRKLVSLAHHLCTTTNQLVSLCYELDLELPKRCAIVARAKDYCASISITTDFQGTMLSSLKSSICERQFRQLMSTLSNKPLHGQFYSLLNDSSIEKYKSVCWLKSHLHSELESTILAIQDQVVVTRVIEAKIMKKHLPSLMCRLCGESEETIVHLMAACSSLAATEYLYQHNLVAGAIRWHLMKVYGLTVGSGSWLTHKPPPLIETTLVKILWDFSLHSMHNHPSNRPDIVLFDYSVKKIYFTEVSCLADAYVPSKEIEKLCKYKPLAHDFRLMYNMSVELIPVVLGCTGIASKYCHTYLCRIPAFTNRLFTTLKKAVILGSVHVLRATNI